MNDLEEIKRKIDIVDLVSQYIALKKAGANYKAPCPFHREKTPSFMVSPEKQIYKCFGCGEGGDVFTFVMKMEGLEFVEALRMLADRAGVVLSKSKSKEEYQKAKDAKSRLYKINSLAAAVFHKILIESNEAEDARKYLDKRGIKPKTIKDFLLGYAPTRPILKDFLIKKGFSLEEIKTAGSPEKFFKRIIFPICDIMGNVIAFTGRTISSEMQPKYLNTPETPIFHKSRVVYGLDKAKSEIKLKKECIVVEGQVDVILSHQAGVQNTVATSGTALTPEHLTILGRYSSNIIFAFDNDLAGQEAQKKAIYTALENELNPKVIELPKNFKDPGEMVEKDFRKWQEVSTKSQPAIEWLIKHSLEARGLSGISHRDFSGQEKKEIVKEILPFIKVIVDKIEQDHYIILLADKLLIRERILREAIDKINIKKNILSEELQSKVNLSFEEKLVGLLILFPKFIKKVVLDLDYRDFQDDFSSQVYKSLQSCYTLHSCNKDLCQGIGCENFLQKNFDNKLRLRVDFLVLETEKSIEGIPKEEIETEIIELSQRIKNKKREKIKFEYAKMIKGAETKGDRQKIKELLEKFQKEIGK